MHAAADLELIIGMFLVVLGLHYLARRLSLPPAAALMVGGGAGSSGRSSRARTAA